ncbi:C40 family peptidase [Gordonia sp. PP30]|uniref:C40 family peptidase n=1 Tax=unclassified Gordonia (in: high G+C Gram-positive bacteria) TaxID=2657482 RepID=UPI001FFED0D7|nr:C40 family peptidase [Gordonia sp. PP30]UQE76202.1 C40 family peptidase [Gordonia sp. PP30]
MSFEFLIAPLRTLIATLGTGDLPAGGPVGALTASGPALGWAAALAGRAAADTAAGWTGTGGTAAGTLSTATGKADAAVGDDGADIAALVGSAARRVKAANTELNALADGFVAAAGAAVPSLTPAALLTLVPLAASYLARGLAVVHRTQSELAGDTAGLARHQAPATITSTTPGAVPIRLPDGSVAYAPNQRAATAVRAALSQRGVPYVWGGTTPAGFDCSGLTQWAYRQAGLELPRLAQDQDTAGFRVSQSDLRPGDLAVWSGHVAMVIGNGQMVEAGDPVQVSAIRTANLDQQFEGFYRPR